MIEVLALGAGQDVGRSCIIVSVAGKRVMFDCGMHMGYHDERRFPDFSLVHPASLTAVVISHFHLDHCGALPFLTGVVGYKGPILMTAPTKTICPLLLEDYRKIVVERRGEAVTPGSFFTSKMIDECMQQVVVCDLGSECCIDGVTFSPIYAGHVLGAAMFLLKVGPFSCLYTGDFNMTPDRHLGAARLPQRLPLDLPLDLLITETTYATTVRESKRARERDFLRSVHRCVLGGGKVLIPTFALGRAQELCLLVDTYWTRMGLEHTCPVYFSAGLAEKANVYYGLHLDWTSEAIKLSPDHSPFMFKNIRPFERHFADLPGPMVLFSTPGMLHSGQSLHTFAKWAGDEKNLLIIPGYCVAGTVGAKVLAGHKRIDNIAELNGGSVEVKLQVKNLSFSAHADAKGILQLIKHVAPRNVMLVHGEKGKMAVLKQTIERDLGTPCYDPPNGHYIYIAPNVDACEAVIPDFGQLLMDRAKEISKAADIVLALDSLDDCQKAGLLVQSHRAQCAEQFTTQLVGRFKDNRVHFDPLATYSGRHVFIEVSRPMVGEAEPYLGLLQLALVTKFHPEIAVTRDLDVVSARSLTVRPSGSAIRFQWNAIDDNLGKAALAFHDSYKP